MTEEKKKKFIVSSVSHPTEKWFNARHPDGDLDCAQVAMDDYAEHLENTLNNMVDEGYDVSLRDSPLGLLLIGEIPSQPMGPTIMHLKLGGEPEVSDEMSQFVTTMMHQLSDHSSAAMKREMPGIVRAHVMKMSPPTAKALHARCEADLKRHLEQHPDPDCEVACILRIVLNELRDAVKLHVQ